ncbi:MAG: DegT/DnrJ/EryC1/StrS aminotransferase [Candidatus Gottesmanbacteria bacterium GW2011_GWB1_43_11]|uniref:DegT/DnrJ/EryC1/StrS aminotransferase n=1 Tax=Candidatus Gottesmanbacteria bacterium GW2011_GWB1_43_11 TaxID=1618446 RepID=A0A0G1CN56_9BACT|nr:MAG: DegT/DnrJ/EryC1/StrS aminotransferase [Candidatus Gottesmanbacteria bacterium GW2011_GWA2_42_16]KKS56116.1 MAG: DegT/DnrJ/EryC1/StrS aminotransferase [Candidatus Gottesmanbacteria bacterium GW2011_GWA1_42_26]KKS82437.1 MAG: DegT/DnrJ/EryC1/StrS aminotransferase [Candidatus Gottesmanbacteria bacterium GW2011_GWC1_43_10]KKS87160.1 MAG: DegT/DnrJ/EryC1/StrS aminotransferase [Candidatus Gottesmanbacteria bacterium GW2011_GWB1_43_11]OGG08518.1 MAG: hypothetical protein A2699_05500 [Candidatu
MKVPQFMPWVGQTEYREIATCFKSNWITEGPKARVFKEKLLEIIGSKYAVLAPNGTLAIYLGLKALRVGPGDEVIVPDFTFIGSATAVEMCGATPVFVDVNRRNFQIDPTLIPPLITKKTRAIMPVHMYGTLVDMPAVVKIAKKYKLQIIEDAAEAIGVHREGKHAGTFGEVGCFSFFADKTITTAEGGLVVTDKAELYERLLYLRNQGRIKSGTFIHPKIGYNLRMTDLQCAVGLAQLSKINQIIIRKKRILSLYQQQLKDIPGITFFAPDTTSEWIPFRVGILVNRAHELMEYLQKKSIETRTFFYPLHRQPAFAYLKKQGYAKKMADSRFPNSLFGSSHGVCLPTFPALTSTQIHYVCKTIKQFLHDQK